MSKRSDGDDEKREAIRARKRVNELYFNEGCSKRSIAQLENVSTDFVGEKFITGRSEPIHFIGHSFKKEPRLRHYERVEGETTDVFIEYTEAFFDRFETPDYAKMDNAMAMIGGRRGKRAVSRAMVFLLKQKVIPIFSVPRKPFSQASKIPGSTDRQRD